MDTGQECDPSGQWTLVLVSALPLSAHLLFFLPELL